jgi:hypothetical protein
MKKIKVTYQTEVLTKNSIIKPDGFSSISFINSGDTDGNVLNDIPLIAGDPEYMLINRPSEEISQNIPVKFTGTGVAPKVIILKTYYNN